jgi:hypothetical protein
VRQQILWAAGTPHFREYEKDNQDEEIADTQPERSIDGLRGAPRDGVSREAA